MFEVARLTKIIIKIGGMSCAHCVKAVTEALLALGGVDHAEVDLENGAATVDYDESKVGPDILKEAIVSEGYDVF